MIRRVRLDWAAAVVVTAMMAATHVGAQTGSSSTGKPAAAPQTAKPAAANPATAKPAPKPPAAAGAAPVIVVETQRGTFEFETFPKEAPKTVAHIVALVKAKFYDGQRVHRVVDGFVIQFGDPYSRDGKGPVGSGGSGKPIGVAEMSPAHPHKVGAVAMAHAGNAAQADSQMYIALSAERTKSLDGGYTVFGQVISGMDVVNNTKQNDLIKRVTIKGATPAVKAGTPAAK